MGMRDFWLRHRHARERSLEAVVQQLESQNAILSDIRWELRQQRRESVTPILRDIRREMTGKDRRRLEGIITNTLADPMRVEVRDFCAERSLGMVETVERLVEQPLSFARFGDGEFLLMLRITFALRFQKNSFALQDALRDVFTRPTDDLIIGFPHQFHTPHWTNVWSDIWTEVQSLAPADVMFGDSHVTRPIFFEEFGTPGLDLWRQVWDGKSVTVVTGRSGRFSLVDEVFGNVADLDTVWSEPENAFEDLDRVVAELASRPRTDLYLLSLGPAATVLARRLADRGMRAIDVGHLSDSYLSAFEGASLPEHRPTVNPDVTDQS